MALFFIPRIVSSSSIILFVFVLFCSVKPNLPSRLIGNITLKDAEIPQKTLNWIAKPLTDALWGYAPDKSPGLCGNHAKLYKDHLKKGSLWAAEMLESSSLSPSGLLAGDGYQLGHYDQCINTQVPKLGISGEYCMVTIKFHPGRDVYKEYHQDDFVSEQFSLHYNPMESLWKKMKETSDPSKKQRNVLHWAVCVPSSCSYKDIEQSLQEIIIPTLEMNGIRATVQVNEKQCSSLTPSYPSSVVQGSDVMKWLIAVSFLLVVIASTIDISYFRSNNQTIEKKGSLQSLMLSYSIYENLSNLKKPDPSDEFACLHGMRTYSMFLIILGHRCLFSYGGPFHNPEFLEERYRCFTDMFLLNGTLIVDTFFLLSAFLTCYMLLLEMQKRKKMDFISVYIYRWTRITPTYMFVVAFQALIFPTLGNGPIWRSKAGVESERCRNNWWTNFLFINNYVSSENLCMFQSWYISCDMHFFIIGMIATQLYSRRPKLGVLFASALLSIVIMVPFLVTYFGKYDGVLRVYMSLLEDPPRNRNYREVYIKSHNRAGAYMIGVLAAFFYHHLKAKKFRFTKGQVQIGGILCACAALSAMLAAWVFYIPGREYSALESALYASLHRILWSSAMSWIIITGGTTGFGVLNPILGLKALLPLSRLTYSVFLIHGMVQLYSVATVRSSEYITFPKLFWMCFGDITTSFILGLLLHLTIEAPIAGIMKVILLPKSRGGKRLASHEEEPLEEARVGESISDKGVQSNGNIDTKTSPQKDKNDSIQMDIVNQEKDKMQIVSATIQRIFEKKEL